MMALTASSFERWRLRERLRGARSLLEFVPLASPEFEVPEHLAPVASLLHRAANGGRVRALVSLPPRHGKTEMLLHFISWYLLLYLRPVVGYVTYAAEVAESKSRHARDLALRMGLKLRDDTSRAAEWRTLFGGGLLATGIGGPLTGHGLNCLLVDDAFKNREEAESPLIRQRNHEWLTSTALTRLEPDGSAIIVHARWHDDDLIGRLSQDTGVNWELLNLPAVDDAGHALWPSRWPAERLREREALVGPYDWASLFLGAPRPRGGRLFAEPARYTASDLSGARVVIACDPAATEKTSADYSAICVLATRGRGEARVAYVLEVWRGQVEIPKLVGKLAQLQANYSAPVHIEAVGGFKAVPQVIRQLQPGLRIVEVTPQGDKFTRALPVAAAWNDGRIRLPLDARDWSGDFLHEVQTFTGVKDVHDDQVDALVYAWASGDVAESTAEKWARAAL